MQDDDDKVVDDSDEPVTSGDKDIDEAPEGDNPPAGIPEVHDTPTNEDQFEDPIASPAITGEESPAGDAPSGEPQDIDDSLAAMGLENDSDGVKPLSSDDID